MYLAAGGKVEFKEGLKLSLAPQLQSVQLWRKALQLHAGEFMEKVKLRRAGGERRKSGTLASQLQ